MARKKPSPLPALLRPLPIRIARLHAKLAIATVIGIGLSIVLWPFGLHPTVHALIAWDVGVAVYLVLTYLMMWRADIESIRKRAAEQDEGAFAVLLLSIVATFASLIAIAFALGDAKQAQHGDSTTQVLLTVATILLSWAFVHTIFSFHYAHEFYGERGDGKIGGLNFPDDKKPDYRDFLYFSLVIGMTSQVSDVTISSKVIRRVAAIHGVLSFFFNLVVLALTVNMVSNLI
jgi:uncharacterized membrane protein